MSQAERQLSFRRNLSHTLTFDGNLRIQQFNIVAMNFFAFPPNALSLRPNLNSFHQPCPIAPKPTILTMITVALTLDFNRFENLIRNKIILEELGHNRAVQAQENKRPSSLPEPRKSQNLASQSVPKTTQKVPGPKTTPAPKPQTPKNMVNKTTQVKPQIPKRNEVKVEITPKVQVVKNKKKICKIQEARKQNSKRQVEVCLLDAAQSPRWRLSQRQKKRIRERLIMRQVIHWDRPNEQKRERRDLRPQY